MIFSFFNSIIPEDYLYAYARMLRGYGLHSKNPTGDLQSLVMGNSYQFIIHDSDLAKGEAQDVYFCEFDESAKRTILIQVMGE